MENEIFSCCVPIAKQRNKREVTSKGTMLMIPNVGRGKKVILNGQKKDDG